MAVLFLPAMRSKFPLQMADSMALLPHGVDVSLLQSSCAIFSEWLAVGGSGFDVIAQSACKWCEIFAASTDKQDGPPSRATPCLYPSHD
mmetsp:Transcript_21472/g.38965  ORF Transcript_21472/g.38965 Transcript_21472/m.38965 type:complete len:89 (+) Transcript_21472:566-832(+)